MAETPGAGAAEALGVGAGAFTPVLGARTAGRGLAAGAFAGLALVRGLRPLVVAERPLVVAEALGRAAGAGVALAAPADCAGAGAAAAAGAAAGAAGGVAAGVTGPAAAGPPDAAPVAGAGSADGAGGDDGVPKPAGVHAHARLAPPTATLNTANTANQIVRTRVCIGTSS